MFKCHWESYLKSKLNWDVTPFLKTCLRLISGGVRAFSWRKGMCLWDWWAAGVLARADTALHERASSHLGREAKAVLHPSVSGKRIPARVRALSPDAKTGGGQREPLGGRRGACAWRDGAFGCWLPAGHGHRARVQVVSKHCHRLHLHPAALRTADEVCK